MEEKLKELKDVVKFAITLAESLEKATADKKVDLTDIGLLMAPLMQVGAAVEGLAKVKEEIKAMKKEDIEALSVYVKEELALDHAHTEKVVEGAVDLAAQIFGFVELVKAKE